MIDLSKIDCRVLREIAKKKQYREKIIRNSGLASKSVDNATKKLISSGLITKEKKTNRALYSITEKGNKLVEVIK